MEHFVMLCLYCISSCSHLFGGTCTIQGIRRLSMWGACHQVLLLLILRRSSKSLVESNPTEYSLSISRWVLCTCFCEADFGFVGEYLLDSLLLNIQDVGVCYAFVEFEDNSSAQNAIKVISLSTHLPIFLCFSRRIHVSVSYVYCYAGTL